MTFSIFRPIHQGFQRLHHATRSNETRLFYAETERENRFTVKITENPFPRPAGITDHFEWFAECRNDATGCPRIRAR